MKDKIMDSYLEKKKFLLPVVIGTILLAVVVVCFGSMAGVKQDVYISEVCSHNATLIHDPVGCYRDYLVISNDSDVDVNLEGYGLSNNRRSLRLFIFPSVIVPAHGSLTVWADIEDATALQYADDATVYTGFRLGDHDQIYMTNAALRECDTVSVPFMNPDETYVRDGISSDWTIKSPTESYTLADTDEMPVFSAESGFYDEDFTVSIEAQEGEIYYTLYGEDPYSNGILYTEPIAVSDPSPEPNRYASVSEIALEDVYVPEYAVDKATVLRAVIKFDDGTYSEEACATYFVGEDKKEKYAGNYLLSLVVSPEDLFSDEKGIYVLGDMWDSTEETAESLEDFSTYYALTNYTMQGQGWRRNAQMILFDNQGQPVANEKGLTGIHGNWSRSTNQKSFNLISADENKLFGDLFENSGNNFVIRTGGTDDARLTNFRDELVNTISENLAVAPQKSLCCQVFLDGEYWGCYSLQDKLDESYLGARYGVDPENINLVKNFIPESDLTEDMKQYTSMIEFVDGADFSRKKDYERFLDLFDIDSVIDYYCAEIYFGNADAFTNNIAFWRCKKTGTGKYEDGKWRFALCDMDSSTGFLSWGADSDTFIEGHWNVDPMNERFFGRLIQNADFREQFCQRFMYLAENDFAYARVAPVIDEFEATYSEPMVLCNRRFKDPEYQMEKYLEKTQVLREFFAKRGEYICDYLNQHLNE